jgi:hypothetical protein
MTKPRVAGRLHPAAASEMRSASLLAASRSRREHDQRTRAVIEEGVGELLDRGRRGSVDIEGGGSLHPVVVGGRHAQGLKGIWGWKLEVHTGDVA